MNRHSLRRGVSALRIGLAVAVAAIAPASYAQPQQLPGPQKQTPQNQYAQPQYGQQDQYRGSRDGRTGENRSDRRVGFLHQRLGITPAQEAAWTDFAREMQNAEMSTERAQANRPDERGPSNVVQRLELRERMLQTRGAELDGMLRALRPLYASFSDEQKRTADQLLFHRERGPGFAGGPGFRNGRPGYESHRPG